MESLEDTSTDASKYKKGFKDVEIPLKHCKGFRSTKDTWDVDGAKIYCP